MIVLLEEMCNGGTGPILIPGAALLLAAGSLSSGLGDRVLAIVFGECRL